MKRTIHSLDIHKNECGFVRMGKITLILISKSSGMKIAGVNM